MSEFDKQLVTRLSNLGVTKIRFTQASGARHRRAIVEVGKATVSVPVPCSCSDWRGALNAVAQIRKHFSDLGVMLRRKRSRRIRVRKRQALRNHRPASTLSTPSRSPVRLEQDPWAQLKTLKFDS